MARRVTVVDHGLGNVDSVCRALEEAGAVVRLAASPAEVRDAARLVLPGVGAFRDGMRGLRARGLDDALRAACGAGVPLLGICLGMQLLAERGTEGGEEPGLGFVPGEVRRLVAHPGERVPHVGWNEVHPCAPARAGLLRDLPGGADVYFVHSYHLVPADPAHIVATTPYAGGFVSVVSPAPNIHGVQFHPEKSQHAGRLLLRTFVEGRC